MIRIATTLVSSPKQPFYTILHTTVYHLSLFSTGCETSFLEIQSKFNFSAKRVKSLWPAWDLLSRPCDES